MQRRAFRDAREIALRAGKTDFDFLRHGGGTHKGKMMIAAIRTHWQSRPLFPFRT
jgi:hypothetical protein